MGRASSTKKVARAAGTGGGRTKGGTRPWVWWGVMAVVVLLGFFLIGFSRNEHRTQAAASVDKTPPQVGDHWHAAYGVYLCDTFAAPITDQTDPHGIHTHGDGVIHIHPSDSTSTGKNANLGTFADAVKMTLTDTELKMPGGKAYKEGDTKCGDKPGVVQVKINDTKLVTTDVRAIRLNDGDLLTIAFAPEGAQLPVTPSAPNLQKLEDVPTTTTAPAAGGATSTTAPAGTDTSSTTAPPTSEPATTTTAKK